jgi:exodeoxyribonuclease VII large subunit
MFDQLPLFLPSSLSVTELTHYLRQLIEADETLQDVWVLGEISNLSLPSSGHIYFSLKDNNASLRCVIWKTSAPRIRPLLQNGALVEAHGSIGIYERDGSYQLYINVVRPAGEGKLYQEFMRLKVRLEEEGLFDPERKRPIPSLPRCIGIVTSPTGAALQDVLNTFQKRYPLAEFVLAPTSVQGESAPREIVAALESLNEQVHPDVILMVRGGGSIEDLWAFNDEQVVRAVVASEAPVITGVGHETDFTLVDFAADFRAPTPTGAAVAATPDKADLQAGLNAAADRLTHSFHSIIISDSQYLETLTRHLRLTSPLWRVQNGRQRLDDLSERLKRSAALVLQFQRLKWMNINQRLAALNPLAVLDRGFAIVTQLDGNLVRSIAQVKASQEVLVRLSDGQFSAQTTDIIGNEEE